MTSNKDTYSSVSRQIEELNTPQIKKYLYFAVSILLALIFVSGPIAIFINLLIFNNLIELCIFAIGTLIILLVLLADMFYLKLITNNQIKNTSIIYITDTFAFGMFVYCIVLLIVEMGVI